MIIVLEGGDKNGKTSLARHLVKKFNAEYIHFSAPKGSPYDEYMGFINGCDPEKSYVVDRFHVGELVYGELYRGKSKLSLEQLWYLDLALQARRGILIHCATDEETVKLKFLEDKEESSKLEDVSTILKMFEQKVKLSLLRRINYNWRQAGDLIYLEEELENIYAQHGMSAKELANYVGSPEPKVLLVGDTKNKNLEDKGVFQSRSGKFLLKCLERAGCLSGGNLGITNSDVLTKAFYEKLGKPKLVCLGKQSLMRLTKLGLAAYHVPHPQWMFRFGGQNAVITYTKIFKGLL